MFFSNSLLSFRSERLCDSVYRTARVRGRSSPASIPVSVIQHSNISAHASFNIHLCMYTRSGSSGSAVVSWGRVSFRSSKAIGGTGSGWRVGRMSVFLLVVVWRCVCLLCFYESFSAGCFWFATVSSTHNASCCPCVTNWRQNTTSSFL